MVNQELTTQVVRTSPTGIVQEGGLLVCGSDLTSQLNILHEVHVITLTGSSGARLASHNCFTDILNNVVQLLTIWEIV